LYCLYHRVAISGLSVVTQAWLFLSEGYGHLNNRWHYRCGCNANSSHHPNNKAKAAAEG